MQDHSAYFCAMVKRKLQKFAELETMDNVFQKPFPTQYQSKWSSEIFQNNNPIVLELACGKGDYTIALAERYPNTNFIGVDIKGNRIHVGAKSALERNLTNVRFLRQFIDHLDEQFAPNEVSEIWITFPDPFLRESKESKRLTSPKFLDIYRKILKPSGTINLKTDSPELFNYTLKVIEEQSLPLISRIDDVYADPQSDKLLTNIQTYYEKKHLDDGRTIRYLKFQIH